MTQPPPASVNPADDAKAVVLGVNCVSQVV